MRPPNRPEEHVSIRPIVSNGHTPAARNGPGLLGRVKALVVFLSAFPRVSKAGKTKLGEVSRPEEMSRSQLLRLYMNLLLEYKRAVQPLKSASEVFPKEGRPCVSSTSEIVDSAKAKRLLTLLNRRDRASLELGQSRRKYRLKQLYTMGCRPRKQNSSVQLPTEKRKPSQNHSAYFPENSSNIDVETSLDCVVGNSAVRHRRWGAQKAGDKGSRRSLSPATSLC